MVIYLNKLVLNGWVVMSWKIMDKCVLGNVCEFKCIIYFIVEFKNLLECYY